MAAYLQHVARGKHTTDEILFGDGLSSNLARSREQAMRATAPCVDRLLCRLEELDLGEADDEIRN